MSDQKATLEERKHHYEIVFWRDHKKMGYLSLGSSASRFLELKNTWESGYSMANILKLAVEMGLKP